MMAKYDVTHSCGHTQEHQLYGPGRGRESKIEWLSERPCTDCWRAEQDAERERANAAAAQANADAGLPSLVGSPKQVAWAETIRADALDKMRKIEDRILAKVEAGNALQAEARDAVCLIAQEHADQADASWWIEHRDNLPVTSYDMIEVSERRGLIPLIVADRTQRQEAKAAQERAEAEERDLRAAQARSERDAARQIELEELARARTFRVGDRADSVVRDGTNLTVQSRDGRTAIGYVDEGEWAIYQIGEHHLSSTHAEMERIASEARAQWERQTQEVKA